MSPITFPQTSPHHARKITSSPQSSRIDQRFHQKQEQISFTNLLKPNQFIQEAD
jgi:hypothetical protein